MRGKDEKKSGRGESRTKAKVEVKTKTKKWRKLSEYHKECKGIKKTLEKKEEVDEN